MQEEREKITENGNIGDLDLEVEDQTFSNKSDDVKVEDNHTKITQHESKSNNQNFKQLTDDLNSAIKKLCLENGNTTDVENDHEKNEAKNSAENNTIPVTNTQISDDIKEISSKTCLNEQSQDENKTAVDNKKEKHVKPMMDKLQKQEEALKVRIQRREEIDNKISYEADLIELSIKTMETIANLNTGNVKVMSNENGLSSTNNIGSTTEQKQETNCSARDILMRLASEDYEGNTRLQAEKIDKYLDEKLEESRKTNYEKRRNKQKCLSKETAKLLQISEEIQLQRKDALDAESDEPNFYEALDKSDQFNIPETEEIDMDDVVKVFEHKREFIKKPTKEDLENLEGVDDVKELLKWNMIKQKENIVTLKRRSDKKSADSLDPEDFPFLEKLLGCSTDAKKEEGSLNSYDELHRCYNDYLKKQTKVDADAPVLNQLNISKDIQVYPASNKKVQDDESVPRNTIHVKKTIAAMRQEMREFNEQFKEFSEKYRKGNSFICFQTKYTGYLIFVFPHRDLNYY